MRRIDEAGRRGGNGADRQGELEAGGLPFPGHTELFAQRTGTRHYAMMFTGGPLKVVLATVHMPLMGLWGKLEYRRGFSADRVDAQSDGGVV